MMREMMTKERGSALIRELEDRVRKTTHGRIRDLAVEEVQGQVVVRGQVSTHHARQLALQAALDMLPGRSVRACITVG